MPTPPLPDEERQLRKETIEQLLREGYAPPGRAGGTKRRSATQEIMHRLDMSEGTIHSWLRSERRHHRKGKPHFLPDWDLYQPLKPKVRMPAGQSDVPDPEQKPTVRIRYMPDEPGDYKVVAIPDTHDSPRFPDKRRFRWLGRFVAEEKPDIVWQRGDWFTLDSLCRYEPNETWNAKRDKPYFQEDMESGELSFQAFDEGAGGYECERHITLGNHEARIDSWSNRHPEIGSRAPNQSMMHLELDRLLAGHGWSYSPFGVIYWVGGVACTHIPLNLMGKSMGGENVCNLVTLKATHDWVFGHTHRSGSVTKPKLGENNYVTAINLGCGLEHGVIEPYAQVSMTGWDWCVWTLRIYGGRIQSYNKIPMLELEERYGHR